MRYADYHGEHSSSEKEPFRDWKLVDWGIFDQIPHPARASAGTKSAADAEVFIHDIFIVVIFESFSADGRLRANRNTDAAVPAGAAG